MAHCRRKFFEALPAERKKGIKLLDINSPDSTPEERKAKRLEQEVPVWEAFLTWLSGLNPTKGGKMEKAANYAWNHR